MKDLLGEDYIELKYTSRLKKVNPMVTKYGQLEGDRRCKDCELSVWVQHNSKVFIKCELRGITRGEGTDHRANWEACSQFRDDKLKSEG